MVAHLGIESPTRHDAGPSPTRMGPLDHIPPSASDNARKRVDPHERVTVHRKVSWPSFVIIHGGCDAGAT